MLVIEWNSNHLWRWDVWQGLKLGNPMQCLVLLLCACDYSVGFTNGLLYFVSMVYFCGGFETLLLTWGRLLCLLKQKRIKVSRKIFFPSLMVLIGYSGGTSMMVSVKSFHLSSNLTIEGSLLFLLFDLLLEALILANILKDPNNMTSIYSLQPPKQGQRVRSTISRQVYCSLEAMCIVHT